MSRLPLLQNLYSAPLPGHQAQNSENKALLTAHVPQTKFSGLRSTAPPFPVWMSSPVPLPSLLARYAGITSTILSIACMSHQISKILNPDQLNINPVSWAGRRGGETEQQDRVDGSVLKSLMYKHEERVQIPTMHLKPRSSSAHLWSRAWEAAMRMLEADQPVWPNQ